MANGRHARRLNRWRNPRAIQPGKLNALRLATRIRCRAMLQVIGDGRECWAVTPSLAPPPAATNSVTIVTEFVAAL